MALVADYTFTDSSQDSLASNSAPTNAPDAVYKGDSYSDGDSAVFDGSGDYLEILAGADFGLAEGTVTISFVQAAYAPGNNPWENPGAHTLFSVDSSGLDGGGHLSIYINSDGTLMVRHQTASAEYYLNGGMIEPGNEVTVAYSWGPQGGQLVVNGETVNKTDAQLSLAGDVEPITIGASQAISGDGTADNLTAFFNGTISRVQISDTANETGTFLPCLAAGTRLLTDRGERRIDSLRLGDLVVTLDRGPQPIRWIGWTDVGAAQLSSDAGLRPVTIRAGALGNPVPLVLSRQHCVLLPDGRSGAFVRAAHLARFGDGRFRIANGIRQMQYVHLLFDRHEIVLAENVPVESLLPGPRLLAAHPDLARHVNGLDARDRAWLGSPARSIASGRSARRLVEDAGLDKVRAGHSGPGPSAIPPSRHVVAPPVGASRRKPTVSVPDPQQAMPH